MKEFVSRESVKGCSNYFHYNWAILHTFFAVFRVSNSLDPDQARHFVGPDVGPSSLQRLSSDTNVKIAYLMCKLILCVNVSYV